ncbi:DNA repair protein RadA [Candidatus Riflebacteria bacterium]
MARKKIGYLCQNCGNDFNTWSGQCPSCQEWNSLVEWKVNKASLMPGKDNYHGLSVISLDSVAAADYKKIETGNKGFDDFLGGGLVPGGVILLAGEPGVGKSTFILQVAQNWAGLNGKVLYISGEESPAQIALRAVRLEKGNSGIYILNCQNVEEALLSIEKENYSLLIVDSIQTIQTNSIDSPGGSILQLKATLNIIIQTAKSRSLPVIVIGHINKSGDIAGPKLLEHLVDTVLYLEKDINEILRYLRAFKNRFGTVEETFIMRMTETGLKEVKNPGAIYLSDENSESPGLAVGAFLKGIRPILCEIQALVKQSFAQVPKRLSSGIDNNRLQMLAAVTEKHANINLFEMEIFSNVVGGQRVSDTGLDLPIIAALISAFLQIPLPPKTFFCGEVGLIGEVRKCRLMEKRINEAKSLGFKFFVAPIKKKKDVIAVQTVKQLRDLIQKQSIGR